MTPRVVEDGDAITIPVEGLSVDGVSVAIRMSTVEASVLADSLDAVVEKRILGSAEWKDGISMKDVRKAEGEGAKLRYQSKGTKITLGIRGLKPCPFCGHRKPKMDMRCDWSLKEPRIFKCVRCWFCCAQTHESACDVLHHVEAWNRRLRDDLLCEGRALGTCRSVRPP